MPNGELQAFEEHRARLRHAVAVGVAQQRDAVRRSAPRAPACFMHLLHDPALDALAVLGPRRRVGLGDQHVAVRQHVEPARMVEAPAKAVTASPSAGDRLVAVRPAAGVRDVDRRDPGLVLGAGSCGCGPMSGASGKVAVSPQAASPAETTMSSREVMRNLCIDRSFAGLSARPSTEPKPHEPRSTAK